MSPITPITSALLFVAVVVFVRVGGRIFWRWFSARARRDASMFGGWLDELFIAWPPEQVLKAAYAANLGIIIVTLVVLVTTGSIVFSAATAFGAYWVPTALYRRAKKNRLQRLEEQLPDAVNIMVSSVRAGQTLMQSFEEVGRKMTGPVSQEFKVIATECTRGGASVEEALTRARARLQLETFTMISSAVIINNTRGGDVLRVLERMSESTRELAKLRKKIMAETAEVRAQEKIILVMTPLFGVLVCLFDPSIPGILFHTLVGNLLLVLVVVLQVVSILWIRRIVQSAI